MQTIKDFYNTNKEGILLSSLVVATVVSTVAAINMSVVGFISAIGCGILAYKLSKGK